MSSKYLFKAKRIDNGEWVEGYIVEYPSGKTEIYKKAIEPPDVLAIYEVDHSTICQCTGLKDKNGKLIWEHDITKVRHEKYPETPDTEFELFPTAKAYTRTYAVEFVNTGSNYGYRCRNRHIHFLITKNVIFNHDVEVVGNIFDNPDLLGEAAEG